MDLPAFLEKSIYPQAIEVVVMNLRKTPASVEIQTNDDSGLLHVLAEEPLIEISEEEMLETAEETPNPQTAW